MSDLQRNIWLAAMLVTLGMVACTRDAPDTPPRVDATSTADAAELDVSSDAQNDTGEDSPDSDAQDDFVPCTPSYDDTGEDMDRDGQPDSCDEDIDGDGWSNPRDNCPRIANRNQDDSDWDGRGDVCDDDVDGDFTRDSEDNCPNHRNRDQADFDGDGIGDVCDDDVDGDGIENTTDVCPELPNPDQRDRDGDGNGNLCDSRYLVGGADAVITGNADRKLDARHVEIAGDINGDGIDDVIVVSSGNGLENFIFYGTRGRRSTFQLEDADLVITTSRGGYSDPSWVIGGGDINGDGIDDLLVEDGGTETGEVYLIYGSPSLPTTLSLSDADAKWEGDRSVKNTSVSAAGDVNRDGHADFIIGAPYHEHPSPFASKPYVSSFFLVYGRQDFPAQNTLQDADIAIESTSQRDYRMTEFAGVGDVDNDGFDDIAVGVYEVGFFAEDRPGFVHLFLGGELSSADQTPEDADVIFRGEHDKDSAGYHISRGGDFDGDGIDDFLVTAPYLARKTGSTYLVLGRTEFDQEVELADLPMWKGSAPGAVSGARAGFIGDMNGDHVVDIMIGEPGWGVINTPEIGANYLYFGGDAPSPSSVPGDPDLFFEGHGEHGKVGYDFAGGGDINDDGHDDLLLVGRTPDGSNIQQRVVYVYYGPLQ